MNESARVKYDMIWGEDIWTELVLHLTFSEHVIEADDGPFNGCKTPMVDLSMYIFKDLNTGKTTPE